MVYMYMYVSKLLKMLLQICVNGTTQVNSEYACTCSVQFANLRSFQIALRKLEIANGKPILKLCSQVYAISKLRMLQLR